MLWPFTLFCRYSIIKNCSHWRPEHRLSTSELIRTLQSGEKSANGRKVLKVIQPLDIEKYLREAGYTEAYNYAVLWLDGAVVTPRTTGLLENGRIYKI